MARRLIFHYSRNMLFGSRKEMALHLRKTLFIICTMAHLFFFKGTLQRWNEDAILFIVLVHYWWVIEILLFLLVSSAYIFLPTLLAIHYDRTANLSHVKFYCSFITIFTIYVSQALSTFKRFIQNMYTGWELCFKRVTVAW